MAGSNRQRRKKQQRYLREQDLPMDYRYRRWFMLSLFGVAAVAVMVSAVDRQVFDTDFLQKEGKRRHLSQVEMPASRGVIRDRRGEILAISTPVDSVWVNPRAMSADSRALAPLAGVLGLKVDDLRELLARYSHRAFVYAKRRVRPEVAEQVRALSKAQGVNSFGLQREYRRYYPSGEAFGHVLGFTDIDDRGQEGIELVYNKLLEGEPGRKVVIRDGRRQVVRDIEQVSPVQPGQDLVLSLDARMQYLAYRALKAASKKHAARSASAVIIDVQSGEVLAMVNQPGFNPNGDRSSRNGRLRNRVLTDAFEPGSTMKPFVVAAGLDAGIISQQTRINTAPGYYSIGRDIVRDHHNLGMVDLETLLRKSSNVGASKIALDLRAEDLFEFVAGLGFGQPSLLAFPGEAAGQLADFNRWARIDQATLSFGYGLSVNTLQLAQAYAALGNDGVIMPASLFRVERAEPGRRVMSAESANAVLQMLGSVVSVDGTAPQAAVAGYRVAGKTGTVKKYSAQGYADDRYRSVFAGVAPLDKPRLAMAVVIDEPTSGKYYGGDVAAPVFAEVMTGALRLLNVVPENLGQTRLAGMEGV